MPSLIQKMLATQDLSIKSNPFQVTAVNFDIHSANVEPFTEFIMSLNNGGFFFNRSFQIYEYNRGETFTDGNYINALFHKYFGKLTDNLFSFGQDIFGFQFAFVKDSTQIIYFNSETGEREVMGNNFNDWLQVLDSRLEYYTGEPLMKDWIKEKGPIAPEVRLIPIKPFVIGGDYEIYNLHTLAFPKYLDYYSDIAHQISNIPDGTPVKLTVKE